MNEIKPTLTLFMANFRLSWLFLHLPFSIFNKLCSASRDLFEFAFHNSPWNFLHVIYLCILKSVKIFKQRTNWKNSFWLKYHAFHKYHTSFNLVGGLKLQYQLKNISLLKGFSGNVQWSSSNSKNLWRNFFKGSVH